MHHIKYSESPSVAILGNLNFLNEESIKQYYINPLINLGFKLEDFVVIGLPYNKPKGASVTYCREILSELLPDLKELGVTTLYVCDSHYLKALTKISKVATAIGYPLKCNLGIFDFTVVYSSNYQALFANPSLQFNIDISNKLLSEITFKDSYELLGSSLIKYSEYLHEPNTIKNTLDILLNKPILTCDIEAFSLRHTKAGLGSIAFAWSTSEGIAINIDHSNINNSQEIKVLLKYFFENYTGKLIFHNATYDVKVLIYELWMTDMLDTEGLIEGLEVMVRDIEDTKIIAYLVLNSCTKIDLSLKSLGYEFAGNYAVDVKDISKINIDTLLEYNLIDCLTTMYVYEKYYPLLIQEQQENVYTTLFKGMLKNIIQMEMVGMPIDIQRTKEVDNILKEIADTAWEVLNNAPDIKECEYVLTLQQLDKVNAKLKTKKKTIEDITVSFKPSSSKHLICLIHEVYGFEVNATSDSGQPSVKGEVLEGHAKRANDEQAKVINAIIDILAVNKIRNTFVKKFLNSEKGLDNWNYLFGSFNIGGTKSGRLSSSGECNLQNLPSNSKFGKLIKSCFSAPKGWLFVGLDFALIVAHLYRNI